MNWYLEVLKKYAVFSGRARRKEYWYFVLFSTLISFGLVLIDLLTGTYSPKVGIGLLEGIYAIMVLIPGMAVTVRRLHDTNHSGWWLLLNPIILVIPFVSIMMYIQAELSGFTTMLFALIWAVGTIGGIVCFIFTVQDSQQGDNQYGPNPKLKVNPSIVTTTEHGGGETVKHQTATPTPTTSIEGKINIASTAAKKQTALDENSIYEIIAKELETDKTDKGLWTRLFAECAGDEKQTKVLYIKQRAERLIANERLRLEQLARESAERSRIEKLANAAKRERLEEQEKRERAVESALGSTDVKNMDAWKLYNIAYNLYDTKKYDKAEIICNYLFYKFPNSMQATWAKNIIGRIKYMHGLWG